MTDKIAWVGKCLVHTQPIADEPHAHPWNAECYAAVWTDTKPHFEQNLRDYFKAQGQYLVWAEDVYPVLHWLDKYGATSRSSSALSGRTKLRTGTSS